MSLNSAALTLGVLADRLEFVCQGTQGECIAAPAAAEIRLVASVPALRSMPLDFQDCIRAFFRLGIARATDTRDPVIPVRRMVAMCLFQLSGRLAVGSGRYVEGSALHLSDAYRAAVVQLSSPTSPELPRLIAALNREIVEIEVAC
jgi:hypothetical protein